MNNWADWFIGEDGPFGYLKGPEIITFFEIFFKLQIKKYDNTFGSRKERFKENFEFVIKNNIEDLKNLKKYEYWDVFLGKVDFTREDFDSKYKILKDKLVSLLAYLGITENVEDLLNEEKDFDIYTLNGKEREELIRELKEQITPEIIKKIELKLRKDKNNNVENIIKELKNMKLDYSTSEIITIVGLLFPFFNLIRVPILLKNIKDTKGFDKKFLR